MRFALEAISMSIFSYSQFHETLLDWRQFAAQKRLDVYRAYFSRVDTDIKSTKTEAVNFCNLVHIIQVTISNIFYNSSCMRKICHFFFYLYISIHDKLPKEQQTICNPFFKIGFSSKKCVTSSCISFNVGFYRYIQKCRPGNAGS